MSKKNAQDKPENKKIPSPNKDNFNPSQRIYVRAMSGSYQKLRRKMGWFFMLLFLLTPWISYRGHQAILIDISKQQFNFFSTTLWPQDLPLLATIFIIAAFALFFITTFLGRVWCGYLCPQTVWTFIYIWFEEKLEGSANKRCKQDKLALSKSLFFKKTIKHLCWLSIALMTGITFVGYFMPIKSLFIDFFSFNSSFWPVFWILFFTIATYANAGWMRSIMCVHICPYARFQSAMFDKDTFIVSYNSSRGEKRGPRSRKMISKAGQGDCIDCNLCVQVCPTGIDIRDGLQYECINCGACIDACNQTMEKMNLAKNLISYTTEHKLAGHKVSIFRPKLIGYGAVLTIMIAMFIYLLTNIAPMRLDILRDRSQLFKLNSDGLIENTYTLKILNKTQHKEIYDLSVSGLKDMTWYGKQQITVNAGEMLSLPVSLAIEPDKLTNPVNQILFKLQRQSGKNNKYIETESRFIGQ